MQEITSLQNQIIKQTAELKQKKYRQQQGTFLVEGLRSVEEAVAYGQVETLFYTSALEERAVRLLRKAEACCRLYQVTEPVMAKLCDTKSPQGFAAVVRQAKFTLDTLAVALGRVKAPLVILDRVQDPGNLGTIIRTADAAGAAGIILLAGSVDVYSPKVVRATMGSLFHLPVIEQVEETALVSWCTQHGFTLAVTAMAASESIYTANLNKALALIIGNEAGGVSPTLLAQAGLKLYIPMQGKAESLNAAMAAGIILFESLRQRQVNT